MKLLTDCLNQMPNSVGNCVLAFSGGLDSCVLLHLLVNSHFLPFIKLWHVHHGLQSEADSMAIFCQQQANVYNIELKLSHLNLETTKANIEATARTARYALFAKQLAPNDCLLTAHHLDDQVETFLLNVLRGSGSAGLRGIASQKSIAKAQLIRPMLNFKREALLDYATQHKIEWFEDPSNSSIQFNRNYIRHKVAPVIHQRWPNYQDSIATVCVIQAETQQLLDDLALIDYERLSISSKNLLPMTMPSTLAVDALTMLTKARQKNVVRYWLRINKRLGLPKARLETFIQQLVAKQGANPIIENNDYDIRLYDGRVFIVDHLRPQPQQSVYDFLSQPVLEVPELNLLLRRDSVLDYLGVKESGQIIQVRFRTEALTTYKSNHRLKRLFQRHKVAPWLRRTTPQLLIDGELTGIWIV